MTSERADKLEGGQDTPKIGREGEAAALGSAWSADEETKATAAGQRFISPAHRRPGSAPEPHARYGWAASLVAKARVLDAGCGLGWGTSLLAEHAGSVVGLDIAPPLIAAAAQHHGSEAKFLVGDICQMPFGAGEFDVIVCFESIEQVADPERAFDEMRRVLKPGGLLLVSSANKGVYPPGNPLHMHEMTSTELEASLRRRFANVTLYRQHTYFASFLGSATTMESGDPRVRFSVTATRATRTPAGQELYAVAAATDGEPPSSPSQVALGNDFEFDEQRRLIEAWQKRAIDAEVRAAAAQAEIGFMTIQQQPPPAPAPTQKAASWRPTAPLRALKRALRLR